MHVQTLPRRGPLSSIDRFAQSPQSIERCDLCGSAIGAEHPHLFEPASRRLLCSCGPCGLLFGEQASGRYRQVTPRCESLPNIRVEDGLWERLGIPVGLAFIYRNSEAKSVLAVYPSPAGPLESLVDEAAWAQLVADNPMLADLATDVEALLVNRSARSNEPFRVSLDRCYELIGLVRTHWRGFSGGPTFWNELELFFARLRSQSS